MELSPPSDVVALVRSRTLLVRIGIWLMSPASLGHEADEAARLRLEAVDMCQLWLNTLPKGSRFIGLTPERLLTRLDEIAQATGSSDCALVYNIDFFLARLKQAERHTVWDDLYGAMPHRPRALIISMPQTAQVLLPSLEELNHWSREKRLAGTNPAG
jgi:hypothetical protein